MAIRGLYELLANGRPALRAVLDRVAGGDLGAHVPPGGVPKEANDFIHSFMSFIHVQSIENFGTRKKRKENMRKATDVHSFMSNLLKIVGHSFIHSAGNGGACSVR